MRTRFEWTLNKDDFVLEVDLPSVVTVPIEVNYGGDWIFEFTGRYLNLDDPSNPYLIVWGMEEDNDSDYVNTVKEFLMPKGWKHEPWNKPTESME